MTTPFPTETTPGAVVSVAQAAELLVVSLHHLRSLLRQGVIPSTRAGGRRHILLSDVIAYKQIRDERRREALDELVALSEEAGLYP